ncbi:hypothetical protein J6590_006985 [Homalodisca vitripennis]|nr:hypothetical protein J6590_006985 [Homalodisca vitripennis]
MAEKKLKMIRDQKRRNLARAGAQLCTSVLPRGNFRRFAPQPTLRIVYPNNGGTWKKLQSQISEAEQILKYTVNVTGRNNITAKWKIRNLETPELHLNSLVVPKSEREMSGETEPDIMDLSSVESLVNDTMRRGKELIKAVDERDRQIWGLEGFRGKVIVKGRLVIENLTVGYLNGHSMDDLLSDTFRKSKPQKILSNTVIDESVQTENIIVKKINNNAVEESLKFNNKPVVMKGNVTFLSPVVVDGDVKSASGKINGMYLSALCEGKENCAVFDLKNGRNKQVFVRSQLVLAAGSENYRVVEISSSLYVNMDKPLVPDDFEEILFNENSDVDSNNDSDVQSKFQW